MTDVIGLATAQSLIPQRSLGRGAESAWSCLPKEDTSLRRGTALVPLCTGAEELNLLSTFYGDLPAIVFVLTGS